MCYLLSLIVITSRGHTAGGGTKPIDHRLEPEFGTDDVPQGDEDRGMPTHEEPTRSPNGSRGEKTIA